MTSAIQTEMVSPSPASLVQSLREIGYTFEHAVADLIDNSVSAGAKTIGIFLDADQDGVSFSIIDNGIGMSRAELMQAMRLGSQNPLTARHSKDLGRFGLGLKTASFSQARRLSVFTRKAGIGSAAVWDLDHISKTDRWEVLLPSLDEQALNLDKLSGDGTIVLWEKIDRLLGDVPLTDKDLRRIAELGSSLRDHLALVFHRFLDGEAGALPVIMSLNAREILPFDPFALSNPKTKRTPPQPDKIPYKGGTVEIQAFTLPHPTQTTRIDWERNAGPGGYVANQGFYLYRAKRLLVWGTWFRLDRRRAINQLCRVRIDVENTFDFDWKVDVKKSTARPPEPVRQRLDTLMDTLTGGTRRVYRRRGKRLVDRETHALWARSANDGAIVYSPNFEHPIVDKFRSNLDSDQERDFGTILQLLGKTLPVPSIFADYSEDPKDVGGKTPIEELKKQIFLYARALDTKDAQTLTDILRTTRQFEGQWKAVEKIIENYFGEDRDQ